MKVKARRLSALVALALSSCLYPAFSQAKDKLISSVLEVTGIEKQFTDLSGMIVGMYQGQQAQIPGESYQKIVGVIADSFGGTNFTSYIRKSMEDGYREDYCRKIIKSYESKLFLDVTAREIDVMRPEEMAKLAGFDYSQVPAARDKLFESFMVEGLRLESQKGVTAAAVRAFIYTYNILLPESSKISKDIEAQAIAATEASIDSKETKAQLKVYFAATYESFTDAQLKEYFGFYSSAEGKWLNEVMMKGFEKGFEACMADAANKLKKAFNLDA